MALSACSLLRVRNVFWVALGVTVAGCCAGCGANLSSDSSLAGRQLHGTIHGGQQPIAGASIQLYAAGTTGYGTSATALLSPPVVSDASGGFTITGSYTCPSASSELYIVATGGNPGLETGTNNPALALMAALGPCSLYGSEYTLDPNSIISINEVTTVASVYALAAFMSGDATHVGTSSANAVGLANSFQVVNNLVNTTTGAALAVTPSGNGTVPQATINTLADILAACANSNGVGAPCSTLFAAATPSGGTAPTDMIGAIYNIASNPAGQVGALYALIPASAPFEPTLAAAPNDWTVGVAYTTVTPDGSGSGATQTAIAIDGLGDAWIANEFTTPSNLTSSVSELSGNGTILSGPAGYTGGGLSRPSSIAVDPSGNVWLANGFTASLSKFDGSGVPLSGAAGFNVAANGPLAIDGYGNVWCMAGGLAKVDSTGTPVTGSPYTVGSSMIVKGISIDSSGNAWLAGYVPDGGSSDGYITKFSNSGTLLSGAGFTATGLYTPWSIANDHAGDAWVTNNNGNMPGIAQFANAGTVLSGPGYTGGGLANPLGIAIDGAGNVWATSDSVSTSTGTPVISSNVVELDSSGNILSGSTGFSVASSGYPVGDAVDGSGNVWVAMSSNTVVQLVGAATPVVTPLSIGVKNDMVGVRP